MHAIRRKTLPAWAPLLAALVTAISPHDYLRLRHRNW